MDEHMFELIVMTAAVAHEVNRVYCQSLGDNSQPSWDDAPDWQKDSAIKGVLAHLESGLTLTPEGSHESWLKEKEETGWKYGPIKDPEKKEHPCFVPYDQLPEPQKFKDAFFRTIVHSVWKASPETPVAIY